MHVPPSAFDKAEVDGQARAEELSVGDWGRLAAAVVDAEKSR
jgi:hypothetical protein